MQTKLVSVCLGSNPGESACAKRESGQSNDRRRYQTHISHEPKDILSSTGLPEKAGKKMLGVQITSLTCELFDVELELGIIILFEVIFECDLTAAEILAV